MLKNMTLSKFAGALNLTDMGQYKIGPMLGQGAYAMVRAGLHVQSNFKVAIKIYDKYKLNSNSKIKQCVDREIQILSSMMNAYNSIPNKPMGRNYSNMKLYDAIDKERHVYLIVENCTGKQLDNVIREFPREGTRKNLPEEICAKIMYKLLTGIKFCHNLNICHRDIKLENLLVDIQNYQVYLKIIDFGFAV